MDLKLAELEQTVKELFFLVAKLASTAGPPATQSDLIGDVRDALQSLDRDLAYAETFIYDVDDVRLRARQVLTVMRYREDYKTLKTLYRRAVLTSRDNIQAGGMLRSTAAAETDSTETHETSRRAHRDDNASSAVLQASSHVTAELRRTHALMSEELSKSALSQELLEESSAVLSRLGDEYHAFGYILTGSKRLIKELENADRVDQLWIWGSFAFFCLVVSFILYRRILSRPVNALIWTGSFVFSRASQRKIIQHNMVPVVEEAEPEPYPQDGLLDLVVPVLVEDEDTQSRLRRAKSNAVVTQVDSDIVHAEL